MRTGAEARSDGRQVECGRHSESTALPARRRERSVGEGRRRQRGVTSIEYALLGALIATAIVIAVTGVGGELSRFYDYVAGRVGCVVEGKASC